MSDNTITLKNLDSRGLLYFRTAGYNEPDFNDVKEFIEDIMNVAVSAFYEKKEDINKKKISLKKKIRDFPMITELFVDYRQEEIIDDHHYDYYTTVPLSTNVILVLVALFLSNVYLYLPMHLTKSTKTLKTLHKVTKYVTFMKLIAWCTIALLLTYNLSYDYDSPNVLFLCFAIILLFFPCLFLIGDMVFVSKKQIRLKLKLKLIIDSCCWFVWLICCMVFFQFNIKRLSLFV